MSLRIFRPFAWFQDERSLSINLPKDMAQMPAFCRYCLGLARVSWPLCLRSNLGFSRPTARFLAAHLAVQQQWTEVDDVVRQHRPQRCALHLPQATHQQRTQPAKGLQLPVDRLDGRTPLLISNSRPSECDSSWFAHFDSDKMMRHHRDVEKDLRYGLLEPEPARFWRSSACFGS